jgi:hypothetical protein
VALVSVSLSSIQLRLEIQEFSSWIPFRKESGVIATFCFTELLKIIIYILHGENVTTWHKYFYFWGRKSMHAYYCSYNSNYSQH